MWSAALTIVLSRCSRLLLIRSLHNLREIDVRINGRLCFINKDWICSLKPADRNRRIINISTFYQKRWQTFLVFQVVTSWNDVFFLSEDFTGGVFVIKAQIIAGSLCFAVCAWNIQLQSIWADSGPRFTRLQWTKARGGKQTLKRYFCYFSLAACCAMMFCTFWTPIRRIRLATSVNRVVFRTPPW